MPAALIYVCEPVHLQLLSIKLYNIPPIVHLPLLSGLPRPVSRTGTRHTHSNCTGRKEEGWKERPEGRGTDRRRDGEVAGRRRGRNSGETRVREGAGEHVEGNVEGGDGGDVHLILPPTGLDRLVGGWA